MVGRIVMRITMVLIVLFLLDWQLALISIVTMPFVFGMSLFFFSRISKVYNQFQDQEAALSTTLQENLAGVRIVKAFARQGYEIDKFEKENREKYRRGIRLNRWHALYWPLADTISWTQLLTGITIGALLAIHGNISLGEFMAYIGLVGQVVWPIRDLGRFVTQMSTSLVSFGRVSELLREEREPLTEGDYRPETPARGEIVFEDVNFEYETAKPVLHNISFRCEAGQTIALLGSTGSGKTSLVGLLPRFYDYTSGSITLDGVELKRYPRNWLRHEIGIIEQEPFLFSRTIRENITYGIGRAVAESEVIAAAQAAAMHDVILSFPKGYDTIVGERGVTLSGGQKQRVALARTLLKNPRILILDDATSSVDTETESQIREALKRLMEHRTTFIIAHRIQSVMLADLILVMDHGRIVQMGSHEELMWTPASDGRNIYRQIYDLQSRVETELEKEIASV
jgi:ATP-binding cassette subfamily B protein